MRRAAALALGIAVALGTVDALGREPSRQQPVPQGEFAAVAIPPRKPSPRPTPTPTPAPGAEAMRDESPPPRPSPKVPGPAAIVRPTATPRPRAIVMAPGHRYGVVEGSRIARAYARSRLPLAQYHCLDELWVHESGWRWNAENRYSGAYGIPQALPGRKMASAGADWRTNPVTQVRWGLGYVRGRYGDACTALSHWRSHGWY